MQTEKDKILKGLHKHQLKQERYYNQATKDFPPLHKGQNEMVINPQSATWERAIIMSTNKKPRSYNDTTENGNTIRKNQCHLHMAPCTTRKEEDQGPNIQQRVRPYEDHAENWSSSGRHMRMLLHY